MTYTATLTGKQQLTVPIELFRKFNWEIGQKVIITDNDYSLSVVSAKDLVDRLAGSVKLSNKFKSLSIDEIIEQASIENHKQK
ncbi:MAG: hypothetical protein AAB768_01705 [Patescibacteria group bacterium]